MAFRIQKTSYDLFDTVSSIQPAYWKPDAHVLACLCSGAQWSSVSNVMRIDKGVIKSQPSRYLEPNQWTWSVRVSTFISWSEDPARKKACCKLGSRPQLRTLCTMSYRWAALPLIYSICRANEWNESRQKHKHQPVSWYLVIPCYEEDITQLLVLQVRLHFTERLLCMICGLEKLIGAVGVHSGEIADNQPTEDETQNSDSWHQIPFVLNDDLLQVISTKPCSLSGATWVTSGRNTVSYLCWNNRVMWKWCKVYKILFA